MSPPQRIEDNCDEMPPREVIGFMDVPKWVIKLFINILSCAVLSRYAVAQGILWSEKLTVRFLCQPIHHPHLRPEGGREETNSKVSVKPGLWGANAPADVGVTSKCTYDAILSRGSVLKSVFLPLYRLLATKIHMHIQKSSHAYACVLWCYFSTR